MRSTILSKDEQIDYNNIIFKVPNPSLILSKCKQRKGSKRQLIDAHIAQKAFQSKWQGSIPQAIRDINLNLKNDRSLAFKSTFESMFQNLGIATKNNAKVNSTPLEKDHFSFADTFTKIDFHPTTNNDKIKRNLNSSHQRQTSLHLQKETSQQDSNKSHVGENYCIIKKHGGSNQFWFYFLSQFSKNIELKVAKGTSYYFYGKNPQQGNNSIFWSPTRSLLGQKHFSISNKRTSIVDSQNDKNQTDKHFAYSGCLKQAPKLLNTVDYEEGYENNCYNPLMIRKKTNPSQIYAQTPSNLVCNSILISPTKVIPSISIRPTTCQKEQTKKRENLHISSPNELEIDLNNKNRWQQRPNSCSAESSNIYIKDVVFLPENLKKFLHSDLASKTNITTMLENQNKYSPSSKIAS